MKFRVKTLPKADADIRQIVRYIYERLLRELTLGLSLWKRLSLD